MIRAGILARSKCVFIFYIFLITTIYSCNNTLNDRYDQMDNIITVPFVIILLIVVCIVLVAGYYIVLRKKPEDVVTLCTSDNEPVPCKPGTYGKYVVSNDDGIFSVSHKEKPGMWAVSATSRQDYNAANSLYLLPDGRLVFTNPGGRLVWTTMPRIGFQGPFQVKLGLGDRLLSVVDKNNRIVWQTPPVAYEAVFDETGRTELPILVSKSGRFTLVPRNVGFAVYALNDGIKPTMYTTYEYSTEPAERIFANTKIEIRSSLAELAATNRSGKKLVLTDVGIPAVD